MRLRRVKKEVNPQPVELVPEGGKQMNTAVILTLSVVMTIGGTLLGFMFGWLANAYYTNFTDKLQAVISEVYDNEEEEPRVTSHPEMLDGNGNMIPFQMAKLISVEFTPSDAFDLDPFPDAEDE